MGIINTNWVQLQMRSPIVLTDITRLSSKMELRLNAIKQGRRDTNQLMDLRSGLNVLIMAIMSLLHKNEIVTNKADAMIFKELQDNFGRMLNILEEKEAKITSMLNNGEMKIKLSPETLAYITEIETILYGNIYYGIKRTLERNPADGRDFLYNLYEIMVINMGIFGNEGRIKGKTTSKSSDLSNTPLSAKDLMNKKGQEKLNNEYDIKFEGFKGLKNDIFEEVLA